MSLSRDRCRLYLITPLELGDLSGFQARLASALAGGDVAAVQLRLKGVSDGDVLAAAEALTPIVHGAGAAMILNDRADLAARAGCDGVHLGQADGSVEGARLLLGRDAMIGVTCHDSRHLAMDAAEAGAEYVAFGAFYSTETKATVHRPELDLLTIWQETMEIPCVAIGGVTSENAAELARAGADFVAASAAVWSHPDGPAAAVRKFNQGLDGAF